MKKLLGSIVFAFILLLTWSPAHSTLIGPEWPAPGGTNYTETGLPGEYDGLTFSYSNFDNTQFDELYWGPWEGAPIGLSMDGNEITGPELMTLDSSLSDFGNGISVWTGLSSWHYKASSSSSTYNHENIDTRLTVSVKDMNSNPISLLDATTLGKDVWFLSPISGNFSANIFFEAYFPENSDHSIPEGWYPADYGFDIFNTYYNTNKTFSGAFYYTEASAPVPEPATILLIGTGLAGIFGIRRKMK